MASVNSQPLGSVLVTGGSGFVGARIISDFLADPRWTSVSVVSRNPKKQFSNANYHSADITDEKAVRALLAQVRPRVIVHAAAPQYTASPKELERVVLRGTDIMLRCATDENSVEAFVYTSSDNVIANKSVQKLTEDKAKLWDSMSKPFMPYGKYKALADDLVLKSNGNLLKTCVLRICGTYGEGDREGVAYGFLKQLKDKQHNVQFGNNKDLFDFNYVGNVSYAHCLAAETLLVAPNDKFKTKVDGEAFFITDDNPIRLWDFAHQVWAEAGDKSPRDKVKVVPWWVMILMASVTEWVCWIIGKKDPPMRKMDFVYLQQGFVLDITKAKERLGYQAPFSQDEAIRRTVKWVLEQEK